MKDVYRVLDRFPIPDKGTIYVIKCYANHYISTGDVFFDLWGNSFKVKGIAMIRRDSENRLFDEHIYDLIFELMDGVEIEGNILLKSMEDISFIYCNHPLDPKSVDEDYLEEYQTASQEHECALFSYDELEAGRLKMYGDISGLTIYRGWMMKPELNRTFYQKLEEKGIILINTPEEYEKYHLLPGWYEDFKDETAYSVWEDKGTVESALSLTKELEGSYIVKDYVKSRKHEWYDACFIYDVSDKLSAEKTIRNFIERQGTDLVGGVVLRKFIRLKSIGFHEKSGMPLSEEYRVFVLAGRIMIIDDYWQDNTTINLSDEECQWIQSLSKSIKSNFITMDLARSEDGKLMIMELGDGQVSGLQQIKPNDFYRVLNA